jgi:lipoate-protein ligase A
MNTFWRFIDSGPCSAAYNMALDEAIATAVKKDLSPPALRIYRWDIPSVSIGSFQKTSDIDFDYCMKKNIPLVRRPTGGRAILHKNEITYSFSVKTLSGIFSKGLFDSYKKICLALSNALINIGLLPETKLYRKTRQQQSYIHHIRNPLCFHSISYGEIMINEHKVIGSAQKRWADGLLQQGSIPFSIDNSEMFKIFRLNPSRGIEKKINGLKEILPELHYNDLKKAIYSAFEETFNIQFILSSPSQEEISLAQELKNEKYNSKDWTFKR